MDQKRLAEIAQTWAAEDPDAQAASEIQTFLRTQNWKELEDRFGIALEFGTAGLRGLLGAGTNRMNLAVVRRTAAGLARYLKATVPDVTRRGIVIGRDGRRMSLEFARETAMVFAAEGIPSHVFADVVPTPVTAFALTHLKAAAAVMVTASHNPPEYNGYKVYWGNGAQIVPPHDIGIARAIDAVGAAKNVLLMDESAAREKGLWVDVPAALEKHYLDAITALRPTKQTAHLSIVYTAMHGVGGRWVVAALKGAGFEQVHVVPEQQEPDGAFPTVRFPNPEEKGAMDLATALAESLRVDVVLANDPDADRLAVMARDAQGALRLLTGNEVGVLLGHFLLTQLQTEKPLVVTTIVSSVQLKAIAATLGVRFEETLTGFKWIANRALELAAQGFRFVMGFEEALGYTVGEVVRDKDGVGSALVVADMAAWCKARGTTLLGYLEEVQREHGLFVASQFNTTLPGVTGAATILAVMNGFRSRPLSAIDGLKVEVTSDYLAQTRMQDGNATLLDLPKSNVLAWELAGGARVTLRPSGTEPKMKVYFEWRESLTSDEPVAAARVRAQQRLHSMEAAFLVLARERGLL